ncbi:histidine kinase [Marinobacter sp.]|uniref:histidine kinase n=1 Tax=Marinobacter sp. TaxID=50741 RepID=UPI0034A450CA
MVLVTFLLAWLVRRRLDVTGYLSGDHLWLSWFQTGRKTTAGQESRLGRGLVKVVLPAILLMGLVWAAKESGWRLALYPLEFVLLLLLMGAPGWKPLLTAYSEAWSRGDMQGAWHHVKDALPANERGAALSPDDMHLSLCKTLVVSLFERFFLVAFWYVVGGIGLAFLARGLVALQDHWPQAAARPRFARIAGIANWIPARLLAFTFGLAGDLAGWLSEARALLFSPVASTDQVLMRAANGALTGYALDPARFSQVHPDEWPGFGGRSLSAIRNLLNRSMLVWVCGIALLVIAGVA